MIADALAELDRVAQQRPALAGPAGALRELLPLIFDGISSKPVLSLLPEQARAKRGNGLPLLRGESLALDTLAFRTRWLAIRDTLDLLRGGANPTPRLLPEELLAAFLAGNVATLGPDAGETLTVLRFSTLHLFLELQTALTPLYPATDWPHGYCPLCGSGPLLGEFRGLEQTRWLRCGWCASSWEFPRLQCPCCGERDHRQLGYLHVEGEETQHRAATCDTCRGYVKMVATLGPLTPPRLLVAEVATLHLDLAAAERGYGAVMS